MSHPFEIGENSKSVERINMTKAIDFNRTMTFIDQKYNVGNLDNSFYEKRDLSKESFSNKNGQIRIQDQWSNVGKSKAWLMMT